MKIAILDDDDGERRQLVTLVQSYLYEHHDEAFEVVDFADEASFRADFSVRPANIAFLDIYLDGEPRGIKIAYDIQREAPDCLLLFITMSPEFALDGFAVKAVHYCIKPVTAAASSRPWRSAPCRRTSGRPPVCTAAAVKASARSRSKSQRP